MPRILRKVTVVCNFGQKVVIEVEYPNFVTVIMTSIQSVFYTPFTLEQTITDPD